MPVDQLRLLALGGGGVRGLSTLLILRRLMETVDADNPPRPCEFFDMIGGTSTGGLIAIMLGRLRMTVGECVDAYTTISDKVFRKKNHRIGVNGKLQGRFDSAELERAVKQILVQRGVGEDALLEDPDASCKVFVCATSKETSSTVCLTSYRSPRSGSSELLDSTRIWQACRATTAATSFFDPIRIGLFGEEFVDGAMGANNPIFQLWREAQDMWGSGGEGDSLQSRIQCLVSLGTGIPSLKPVRDDVLGIWATLRELATETETTADRFCSVQGSLDEDGRYFRFNVDRGLDDVGLEESRRKNEIAAATRRYVETQPVFKRLKAFASSCLPRPVPVPAASQSQQQSRPKPGRRLAPDNRCVYVPVKHSSPHFTGQAQYLDALVAYFRPWGPAADPPSRRKYLLYGIGGIGKTQICLRFAEDHSDMFWRVYWVDATNKQTLELSFGDIGTVPAAARSGVKPTADSVMKWLSRLQKEWLLVLDNADGGAELLDAYVPSGVHANVLINSRNPGLRSRVPADAATEVVGMSPDDGKGVLSKASHIAAVGRSARVDAELDTITAELHALPLALDHAGSAILCGLCDVHDYRAMLRRHRKQLLANQEFRGAPGYSHTLYSTWSLATNLLEERARSAPASSPYPAAVQLLNMFGFFHHSTILEDTFRRAAEAQRATTPGAVTPDATPLGVTTPGEPTPAAAESLPPSLPTAAAHLPQLLLSVGDDGAWDPLVFRQAVQRLSEASLVRRGETGSSYSVHPLVHQWSRERLARADQQAAHLAAQAVLSASITCNYKDCDDPSYCRQLTPHVVALRSAAIELRLPDPYLDDAASCFWNVLYQNGAFPEAEACASRMRDQREQFLGPGHLLTINADQKLMFTQLSSKSGSQVEESLRLCEKVLLLRPKASRLALAEDLQYRVSLGIIYKYMGNFRRAEGLLKAVWATARQELGEEHPVTTQAASQLSSVYQKLGAYDWAEPIQRQLFLYHTVDSMFLANTLKIMEALKRQIVDARTKKLGEDHEDTLMARTNLAAAYVEQRRWHDAELVAADVIRRRAALPGHLHRETLRSRLILVGALVGQGRLAEAEPECVRLVEGMKITLGEDHAHTLWATHLLAEIWESLGRVPEAVTLWEQTLAMQRANPNLGPDHWETALVAGRLAAAKAKLEPSAELV